ncbi:MAG: heavy metal translocating P-type ATPase [Deltaproteobacteria bacterium]|jgi:Cu2+-exporting ATPase|nr:heavy metal translocating P-type ATPase [Deltaproteobacteria bacterium]
MKAAERVAPEPPSSLNEWKDEWKDEGEKERLRLRRRLLRHYYIAHCIPGRLRLRPLPGAAAQNMADLRAAFPGAELTVSSATGSVLVLYAGAAQNTSVSAGGHTRSAPGFRAVARNPIPGKLRSLFYPRMLVSALAVFRALPYMLKAVKNLLRGRLNLDVLDGAALLVCILQRDFRTLSSLTFFFALGGYLEDWTRKKSRVSLEESLALHVDYVWIRDGAVERRIPFSEARPGDCIVVRAGSALPVDGTVVSGEGMVNQASMTGEAMPVRRSAGASVYAGSVLEQGELLVKASRCGGNTRIHSIIRAIEESENVKASVQSRYERMADAIVPYNFLLSGVVYAVTRNLMRSGSVLLVDYSCAIRLAAPLAVFACMREAADNGVLIKGGKFMEAIARADVVVFDKTGTLTRARPALMEVIPFGGRRREDILRLAACLEEHFPHPVGQAVVRAAEKEGLKHREEHTQVEFIVAHGIASTWKGRRVLIGSARFIVEEQGIVPDEEQQAIIDREAEKGRTVLYLGMGGKLAGVLSVEDEIRDNAAEVVRALRAGGVKRVVMLTGDGEKTAAGVAARVGIHEFRSRMLPGDKADFIHALKKDGCFVAMIGDGINDSPALSAAHVGVAMMEGADVAREVADIVLTSGDLGGLLTAGKLSRGALRRIHSGFRTSLFWNSVFLAGGLLGALRPGLSAFLHNATTAAIAVSSLQPLLPPVSSKNGD